MMDHVELQTSCTYYFKNTATSDLYLNKHVSNLFYYF